MKKKLINKLQQLCPNAKIYQNYNLQSKHTYHINCIAKTYIQVYSEQDAFNLLNYLDSIGKKCIILGGGSNIIFKQTIISKIVVHLLGFNIKKHANRLSVYAGTTIAELLHYCVKKELTGLEWSAGIPASIGGAIVINMGAFGKSISQFVTKVRYYQNGCIITKKVCEQNFSYRYSYFKNIKCVILSVELKLQKDSKSIIKNNIQKYLQAKRLTQPVQEYSCGCVFKNFGQIKAAKLIEDCSLKGFAKNGAKISTKHSNFIINYKNATSKDILYIIRHVKKVIQKRYNVCIFCEVVIQ